MVVNELALFLAAGVLAAGISSVIASGAFEIPIDQFDAVVAAGLLFFIVGLGAIGIHPVIPISSLTPLVLVLDPSPTLLAITYLMAWNLGTCASPLSGTNLVFQGRYGIPSWKAAIGNYRYVLLMLVIGAVWLQLIDRWITP